VILQLAKFGLVGITATAVHSSVATSLLYFFDADLVVANLAGYFSAVSISYLGNALFVFRSRPSRKTLYRFSIVSAFSFFLVLTFARASQMFDLNKYLSVLLIAILVPITSFILHRYWTFFDRTNSLPMQSGIREPNKR
jgi:putative flippase GtrA